MEKWLVFDANSAGWRDHYHDDSVPNEGGSVVPSGLAILVEPGQEGPHELSGLRFVQTEAGTDLLADVAQAATAVDELEQAHEGAIDGAKSLERRILG